MSLTNVVTAPVVTPAGTRRRPRGQQLRGPIARPQRLDAPGGRPVQPVAPALGGPVRLRQAAPRTNPAAQPGLRLTDRGVALVVSFFMALALVSVAVIATLFFSVSNAPLDGDLVAPAHEVAISATGVQA